MKTFFGILSLLSILSFSVACNREGVNNRGVQREEALEGEMFEEDTENYNRALPAEEQEGLIEREEEELMEE